MALAETFTEDWESGSINAGLWTAFLLGESVIQNGGFVLRCPSAATTTNYSGVNTISNFDLTGSYIQSQLKYAGDQSIASWQAEPINFSIDASNSLHWYVNAGNLHAQKHVAGAFSDVRNNVAYNPSRHQYFRIRESGGTIFWDTSPDGYGWENYTSLANPFAVTACTIIIQGGTFAAEANATFMLVDNINIVAGQTQMQTFNPGLTWLRRFGKNERNIYQPAVPIFLGNNFTQAISGSMTPTGVLAKQTIRGLTGALPLSGVLTKLVKRALTGSLPLSGVLTKLTQRNLTGSMTPSGVLSFVRRYFRSLVGSMTPTGVLTKQTRRSLSGSLPLSGILNKRTFRNLTGSMTPHGVVTMLKLFVRALTGSMTPTGTLSKQTRRNFTASISFIGLLASFIPPVFTPIKTIISSFSNKTTDDGSTNIANAGGGVTISNDNSPTNQSSVSSEPNDIIISSGPNQETLEG